MNTLFVLLPVFGKTFAENHGLGANQMSNIISHSISKVSLTLLTISQSSKCEFWISNVHIKLFKCFLKKKNLQKDCRGDHITPGMEELEWLPIKDLLLYRDSIMTYKCIHGMAPYYLTSKFCNRASIHGRKTQLPL